MTNEMEVVGDREVSCPLTANAVVARVRLVQEVMKAVMKKDTHYGTIPGCPKPSLWKPGAEQLLVTFRIAPEAPKVEDLSNGDSIRYRLTRNGVANGVVVASGVGEASSDEEKYKWRKPVSKAEFEATPEDRRRLKYTRDGSFEQVRTNPADVANTILKMADKRAFIAMTLLATAASDIFTQDLEDLPQEIAEGIEGERPSARAPINPPTPKVTPAVSQVFGANADKTLTFVPAAFSEKEMSSGSKKFGIKHGEEWYGTFDEQIGANAKAAKETKTPVTITWEFDKTGKYKNILTLTA